MKLTARRAVVDDVPTLEILYRSLEEEMTGLHAMWPLADALNEPVGSSLSDAIRAPDTLVLVGEIDEYPFGFLVAKVEVLLGQAKGELVGSIRLIYVDYEAREVALGEVMRDMALDIFRKQGITKFDAHVLPGHRLAKNFFESGGFSARSIIMHHDDDRK